MPAINGSNDSKYANLLNTFLLNSRELAGRRPITLDKSDGRRVKRNVWAPMRNVSRDQLHSDNILDQRFEGEENYVLLRVFVYDATKPVTHFPFMALVSSIAEA